MLAGEESSRQAACRACRWWPGCCAATPPAAAAYRRRGARTRAWTCRDAVGGQVIADPRVDRAEVLPDRQHASLNRRTSEDPYRRHVIVTDVRSLVGGHARGHPPQPAQAHHMIHPQRPGVPHRRRDRPASGWYRRSASRSGCHGCDPQSWPRWLNSSGGAPTVTPETTRS